MKTFIRNGVGGITFSRADLEIEVAEVEAPGMMTAPACKLLDICGTLREASELKI